MPIRINFLAEQQEAEEMRRRDPLKRAVLVGGFIVLLGVLGCGYMQLRVSAIQGELKKKQDEYAKLEKPSKLVGDNFKKISDIDSRMIALRQLSENRTLWGPVLNSLQRVLLELAPPGDDSFCPVTVLRFSVGQRYDYTEGKKPTMVGATKVPGKPATSTERTTFTIAGRDFGTEQEQNYNRLKEKLTADRYLKEQLRKDNPVQLKGFQERQIDPTDSTKSFVNFTLECNYAERVR